MSLDQRRYPRKKVNTACFLYTQDGLPIGECRVKDISVGGARLAHTFSEELPAEFLLSLSRDGKVRRRCQIAWRGENQIGVRFVEKTDRGYRPRRSLPRR